MGLKGRVLTLKDAEKIRNIWKHKKISQTEIAKMYRVSRGCISGIVYGVSYLSCKAVA